MEECRPTHVDDDEGCGKELLRVAVVADRERQPAALIDLVRSVLNAARSRLVGLVLLDEGPPTMAMRLFDALEFVEERLRMNVDARRGDLAESLRVPVSAGHAAASNGGVLEPGPESLDALRRLSPDLVLCLTRRPLKLPADIARFGAPGLEAGGGIPVAASWAGAAELADGRVQMLRLVDYAGMRRETYVACLGRATGNSLRRTRADILARGSAVLRRHVARKAAGLGESPLPRLLEPELAPSGRDAPSVRTFVDVLVAGGARWLRRRLINPADGGNSWHLAYVFTDRELPEVPLHELRYLAPPAGYFWADPFALQFQGRHWILFEEIPIGGPRGRLRVVEVREDSPAEGPVTVLERPYHLSYPQVFHWRGELFLMPESRQARRIELLRCLEFPHRWECCGVLLDGHQAADATLWQDVRGGGRWWMFVNLAAEGVPSADELHLYWADAPPGPWHAHPGNPVCADVRCSRPAGPLFERNGELFRPSQDGGRHYGEALWINRIDRLDESGFCEQSVQRIEGGWDPAVRRVHTVGRAGRLTVLDCALVGAHSLPLQPFSLS